MEGGGRHSCPRACALGYHLTPLTGLSSARPHRDDFFSEFLGRDTRSGCKSAPRVQKTRHFVGPNRGFAIGSSWFGFAILDWLRIAVSSQRSASSESFS